MRKRKTALGILRLTRYQEFLIFVTITTLLGIFFTGVPVSGTSLWKGLLVLAANMLSVCFSFMINDVEDAEDDSLNPDKVNRNPISAGALSRRMGTTSSFGIAFISALAYYPLGLLPFALGIITLIIGFFYSWKVVRLKTMPIIDLISHGFMLAALQFLCAYFTFRSYEGLIPPITLPLIVLISLSIHGELFNESRDFTYDKVAGLTHTAALIGLKTTSIIMKLLLVVSIVTIGYGIFLGLLPISFLILFCIFGGILSFNYLMYYKKHKKNLPMHEAQQYILVITLAVFIIWFILFGFRIVQHSIPSP